MQVVVVARWTLVEVPTHASIQAGCAEREREAIFLVASFGFDNIPVISSYIFRFDVSHDATRVI
jgi:hypothetical protein